ncbi:hypothetical protein LF63_0111715 [Oleiagrimonas soli]|uniref:Uncharacterized protein n=1 Tax=Oleiagrimonas soli TaxID=1543381 RepID=A0A099CUE1_9GAMM|nr:hypothetical protein LF63_0111715 [Oleiagrimonas soli]
MFARRLPSFEQNIEPFVATKVAEEQHVATMDIQSKSRVIGVRRHHRLSSYVHAVCHLANGGGIRTQTISQTLHSTRSMR